MSWLGEPHRHFAVCGSTSDEAFAWAAAGAPHGAIVTADVQEKGRGQKGRSWITLGGEQILLSAILRPTLPPMLLIPFTLAAGLAVCKTVRSFGLSPALKWPNDLLLDGKKVAGVLTEMASRGGRVETLIVGIGINVNASEMPPELAAIATSLSLAASKTFRREKVVTRLLHELALLYDRFVAGECAAIVSEWKTFAPFLGKPIVVRTHAATLEGIAEDVDARGVLLVRDEKDHVHEILSGEISAR